MPELFVFYQNSLIRANKKVDGLKQFPNEITVLTKELIPGKIKWIIPRKSPGTTGITAVRVIATRSSKILKKNAKPGNLRFIIERLKKENGGQ